MLVSDRAKQSLFYNPVGLLPTKLQLMKISILGHMIHQGHMTLETQIGHISATVRDRDETEQIFKPCEFTTNKITTFENIDFGVT